MWFQEDKSRPPKKKVTPGGVQSVGVKSVPPPTVRSTLGPLMMAGLPLLETQLFQLQGQPATKPKPWSVQHE